MRGGRLFHDQPKTYWLRPLHRHGLAALAGCFDSHVTLPPTNRPVIDMDAVDIDTDRGLPGVLVQLADYRLARGRRQELAALLAVAVAVDRTGRWPRTPGVITSGAPATLVGHPDLHDIGTVVGRDSHPCRAHVADHVGDRLLQDPVGGVVHRARQWCGGRGTARRFMGRR